MCVLFATLSSAPVSIFCLLLDISHSLVFLPFTAVQSRNRVSICLLFVLDPEPCVLATYIARFGVHVILIIKRPLCLVLIAQDLVNMKL